MTNREIDALVAEKVMGWPKETSRGRAVVARIDGTQDFHDGERWRMQWSPSTDIAAAWQVVEKMRKDGLHLTLQESYTDGGVYLVEFWDNAGQGKRVHHASAPMAICLGALAAVGVEVPA